MYVSGLYRCKGKGNTKEMKSLWDKSKGKRKRNKREKVYMYVWVKGLKGLRCGLCVDRYINKYIYKYKSETKKTERAKETKNESKPISCAVLIRGSISLRLLLFVVGL